MCGLDVKTSEKFKTSTKNYVGKCPYVTPKKLKNFKNFQILDSKFLLVMSARGS